MPSLHETTDLTKKIGLWGGIAIVAIIVLVFTFRTGRAIKNYFLPPGPPPATVGFGKVSTPRFPENVTKEKLQYSLDTISGVLPSFPTQLKVYKVVHNDPSLLNFQRAKEKVEMVGFSGPGQKESDEVYKWIDDSSLTRTMTMNTTTQNFVLNSFYSTYEPIISGTNLPDETGALETAKNFLNNMDLLPEDIDISKTTPQLFSLQKGLLLPASSLSTTQIIRVDLFQKDRDDIPMYYVNPPQSSMYFLIAGGSGSEDYNSVVDGKFFHQKIEDEGQTYPIKSAEQAFTELQEGKGYIASYYGSTRDVKITDVTLGYFLSNEMQDFLTPVIVFQGDGQFFAYVQAVQSSWVK